MLSAWVLASGYIFQCIVDILGLVSQVQSQKYHMRKSNGISSLGRCCSHRLPEWPARLKRNKRVFTYQWRCFMSCSHGTNGRRWYTAALEIRFWKWTEREDGQWKWPNKNDQNGVIMNMICTSCSWLNATVFNRQMKAFQQWSRFFRFLSTISSHYQIIGVIFRMQIDYSVYCWFVFIMLTAIAYCKWKAIWNWLPFDDRDERKKREI